MDNQASILKNPASPRKHQTHQSSSPCQAAAAAAQTHSFRKPISRLLASRNRNNGTTSVPNATTHFLSSSSAAASSSSKIRPSASLPLRKQQRSRHSRSCSPRPSSRLNNSQSLIRRQYRMARRFPNYNWEREKDLSQLHHRRYRRDHYMNSDMSLEAMDDFFESFAPPSLHSFPLPCEQQESRDQAENEVNEDNDDDDSAFSFSSTSQHAISSLIEEHERDQFHSTCSTKNLSRNETMNSSETVLNASTSSRVDNEIELSRFESLSSYDKLGITRVRGNGESQTSEEFKDIDEAKGAAGDEVKMLRHLMQAELREAQNVEDSRYSALADFVNETQTRVNNLEEHIDEMTIKYHKQVVESKSRPSVQLAMMILDTVSWIILMFIGLCITKPVDFIRRYFKRSSSNKNTEQSKKNIDQSHHQIHRRSFQRHSNQLYLPVSEFNLANVPNRSSRNSIGWRLSNRDFEEAFCRFRC